MRNGLKALFGAFCGLIVALLAVRSLSAHTQRIGVIERVVAGGIMGGGVGGGFMGGDGGADCGGFLSPVEPHCGSGSGGR